MLYRLDNVSVADLSKMQTNLKHTILQIDKWDASYLWLFLNMMDLYSFSDLEGLMSSIFNHYKNDDNYTNSSLKILAGIVVKYVFICKQHDLVEVEMQKNLEFLDELSHDPAIFVEKLFGQYFKAELDHNEQLKKATSWFS
ncbi:hypothetical protein [Lactobacillus sp. HT06-2]|uniref:hypothetical protein n=1 Tax=Lactobacillus sp. HT06-2 TaxID=2080222 RepID=UPI000CD9D7A3|nr:hypothetical protein [Lactobacillus sp. HT06-2]